MLTIPSTNPDWIEQGLEAIDEEVISVGHSFGGSVLLKYLAEGSYRKPVPGLFLVSVPNWGPDGRAYDEFAAPNDVGSRLPHRGSSHITVAMIRRCRSRIWATTRRTSRRRRPDQSTHRSIHSLKGSRRWSTTSRACLAEDQLVSDE
jgi:alpha-beta hydrolase superfamily lysophospholipase